LRKGAAEFLQATLPALTHLNKKTLLLLTSLNQLKPPDGRQPKKEVKNNKQKFQKIKRSSSKKVQSKLTIQLLTSLQLSSQARRLLTWSKK